MSTIKTTVWGKWGLKHTAPLPVILPLLMISFETKNKKTPTIPLKCPLCIVLYIVQGPGSLCKVCTILHCSLLKGLGGSATGADFSVSRPWSLISTGKSSQAVKQACMHLGLPVTFPLNFSVLSNQLNNNTARFQRSWELGSIAVYMAKLYTELYG